MALRSDRAGGGPIPPGLRLVPPPRGPQPADADPPAVPMRLRAEVRAAAIASGDIAALTVGAPARLGLALDHHALAVAPPGSWRPDAVSERADGVDLRGTLVAVAVGPERRSVLEVRGVPVLLLGRGRLPPVGSRVLASGFVSVERRLWALCGGRGTGWWTVTRLRRQHLDVGAGVLHSVDLLRLPAPDEVDVAHTYVLDLARR